MRESRGKTEEEIETREERSIGKRGRGSAKREEKERDKRNRIIIPLSLSSPFGTPKNDRQVTAKSAPKTIRRESRISRMP